MTITLKYRTPKHLRSPEEVARQMATLIRRIGETPDLPPRAPRQSHGPSRRRARRDVAALLQNPARTGHKLRRPA